MDEFKSTAAEVPKKGKRPPGRPPINPKPPRMERVGISSEPKKDDNCIEFQYDSSPDFRKAIMLFKAFSSKQITFHFDKRGVSIKGRDHFNKSLINVRFDGGGVVHYYCEEERTAVLNMTSIEKTINTLDKNFTLITIVMKKQSSRSSLIFILRDSMEVDAVYDIKLIPPSHGIVTTIGICDERKYPIQFTMPSRYFKKWVNDINSNANTLTIRKVGIEKLSFIFKSEDQMINAKMFVRNPEMLKLKSSVGEGDIFSSAIKLDYVAPLAKSLIGAEIVVSVSESEEMMFSGSMDSGSIVIRVMTSIININT
jgi:hypothetical protein